jgi:hypothetical protein
MSPVIAGANHRNQLRHLTQLKSAIGKAGGAGGREYGAEKLFRADVCA